LACKTGCIERLPQAIEQQNVLRLNVRLLSECKTAPKQGDNLDKDGRSATLGNAFRRHCVSDIQDKWQL